MPFNGSGTYAAPASSWNPAVAATTINSTDWIALLADMTTALSLCITKDGQQTTTATIPFATQINSTLVTDATSTVTGAIKTAGGMGIAKALWVGGVANSSGANFGQTTLNYYGEGTWTPSLGGSTTYTTQTGIYTRVGRLINCQCELNINSIGTGSTSTITGLPFTVNGTASGQVGTFSTLATNVLGFWCYATSTVVTFQSLTAAGTSATNSPAIFGSSAALRCSVTFHI